MDCDAVGLRAMVQRTGRASGAIQARIGRESGASRRAGTIAHKIALSIKTLAEHGMRILVIEDEVKTGAYLKKGLEESGYRVDVANDGAEGLILAQEENYDVIVLDVMLPTMDGWAVLKTLRATRSTPVLFLTARDEVADRVRGLELGADDYLVKPFAFVELLARVRTLARRGPPRESEQLKAGDLEIDVARRRVRRGATRIDLTPREFALLQLLVRRQGEVLSRTQIASYVWDMNFDSDTNVVEVAIRRLRAKIDDDFPVKLIQTVRGVGYVIEAKEAD
jgi:two-component system copper resistance phosphate regulon response regulator CusR